VLKENKKALPVAQHIYIHVYFVHRKYICILSLLSILGAQVCLYFLLFGQQLFLVSGCFGVAPTSHAQREYRNEGTGLPIRDCTGSCNS